MPRLRQKEFFLERLASSVPFGLLSDGSPAPSEERAEPGLGRRCASSKTVPIVTRPIRQGDALAPCGGTHGALSLVLPPPPPRGTIIGRGREIGARLLCAVCAMCYVPHPAPLHSVRQCPRLGLEGSLRMGCQGL